MASDSFVPSSPGDDQPSVLDVASDMARLVAGARAGLPRRTLNLRGCGVHCADRYGSTCGECDAVVEAFEEEVAERAEVLTEDAKVLAEHIFCDVRADLCDPLASAIAAASGHPAAAELRSVLAQALVSVARERVEAEWIARGEA